MAIRYYLETREGRKTRMRSLVVVDSQFGNTAQIGRAIGRGLAEAGEVQVIPAAEADLRALLSERFDLIVLGGPTVNRGMTAALAGCVEAIAPSARGLFVATFDTRYRGSELLLGSAAKRAGERLQKLGSRLVAPKESFFVVRMEAPQGQRHTPGLVRLADGEEARAEAWGRTLVSAVGGVRQA
jgi:flavodoxin